MPHLRTAPPKPQKDPTIEEQKSVPKDPKLRNLCSVRIPA